MVINPTIPTERPAYQPGKDDDKSVGHFQRLATLLHCLRCGGELELQQTGFGCVACSTVFPVTDRVARFVESQGYAANFGFEWTRYARTQLDDESSQFSERQFLESTGFNPHELRGKL